MFTVCRAILCGAPPLQKTAALHALPGARRDRRQRAVVSPMVQYRATDGQVNDYHIVHLGKFALGKFGIVFTENCAIEQERLTRRLGMWDDGQIEGHKRLARFLQQEGALNGNRITHAGRKGGHHASSTSRASSDPKAAGWQPWQLVGPSDSPAGEG